MKITRPAMRRIYQAYLIKNNNCSSSEKKICSHWHQIIFGRLAGTRVQRPGGARAGVEGAIDILHPGPGSNSPRAGAAAD